VLSYLRKTLNNLETFYLLSVNVQIFIWSLACKSDWATIAHISRRRIMTFSFLRRAARTLLFAAIFGLTLQTAHAADTNGRIKGLVTDSTSAVIPGAQVTATNTLTGVAFKTVSQKDGEYLFAQLPVGTYSISVTAPGFKGFTATGIVITIDQEYVEPVKLTIGDANETLSVQADPIQVNTTDMQLNNVVNSDQILELPLISRAFSGLELILPGVQAPSDRFGSNYSVSGSQTQQSEYLINGADSNDIALNTLSIAPNLDAIDQFNLIDGPLNAEYDRNSGGIVSATIKEGTNHFHGDVFEFYRDTFLNTANFFQYNSSTNSKFVTPYHQNIFGGTIGGPIFRDKLFFFGAYQGTHQRVPGSGGVTDTLSQGAGGELGGNFAFDNGTGSRPASPTSTTCPVWGSFSCNPIPSTITIAGCGTAGETWSQCAYDLNGIFPTANFNSIATALSAKYLPAPNNGPTGYNFNSVTTTTTNQYIGRLDYAFNSRNQITALGIYQKSSVTDVLPFTGASLPGFGDQNVSHIQQYTADYIHQFSASAVNDLSAHWTRFNYQAVIPQNVVTPSSLGFSINPQDAAAASVPTISVGGNLSSFTLGFSTNGPQPRIDQVYQLDDSITKTFGHHQFKFGYDGRRFNVSNPFYANNSGSFGFNSTGNSYGTGDGALDFLLGVPSTYAQGSGASIQADAYLNYFYAQDSWKLSDSFTLDYGIGYSIDTPLRQNQYQGHGIACLIPGEQSTVFPDSPAGFVYGGDVGCSNSGQAFTHYKEFGPRVGFAWAPNLGFLSGGDSHKFSVRAGFGIYYDRTEEESSLQTLETPPFGTSTQGAGSVGGSPQFANPFADINGGPGIANPFPYAFPTAGAKVDYSALEPLYNISTYGPGFRAPYAENFQLTLEREFPARVIARIGYVGSLAHRNQSVRDANPETAAGHAACVADTTYCSGSNPIYREEQSYFFPQNTAYGYIDPNTGSPAFLDIGVVDSEGASNYNSLQASVEKGLTHGLFFQMSYTYAHAMDTASSFENSGFGIARGYNQFNPLLNYGNAAFDTRHRFVLSPIYRTPIVKSHEWYTPINLATSGWEISGIITLATGQPVDVSYAGGTSNSEYCPNFLNYYACPDVPNQVAPVIYAHNLRGRTGPNGAGQFFSKTSFTNEALGTFGNVARDSIHGPGLNNSNIVLAKNFNLSNDGVRRLQLRMESDNVFNHTQFSNPSSTWADNVLTNSNTGFGYVSGAASARQTQLAAKFTF
jgi:hypothetical protein